MIVKASIDTETCYGVKQCTEFVLRKGKMIKEDCLFWKKNLVYYEEEYFMEENQAMIDYIQRKAKVAEDSTVSKRFIKIQKLEWHATWLQQQTNGLG